MIPTIQAGYSDKYGHVFVERVGNTGFDDPEEPIALFRAQDVYSIDVLKYYLEVLNVTDLIPLSQIASVKSQLENFKRWHADNPDRIRIPGTSKQ